MMMMTDTDYRWDVQPCFNPANWHSVGYWKQVGPAKQFVRIHNFMQEQQAQVYVAMIEAYHSRDEALAGARDAWQDNREGQIND